MIQLASVSKPELQLSGLESMSAVETEIPSITTPGSQGVKSEQSRSLKFLAVKGKSEPLPRAGGLSGLESIIGTDERKRILDTDLAPWRMVCALRMRGTNGSGAIGTGWLVGPKTIITAGHCVFDTRLLGGWASRIEISPGRNGPEFPYGTVASEKFASIDRWVNNKDPDFDIGCIHLNETLGERVGWFAVGALSPSELEVIS